MDTAYCTALATTLDLEKQGEAPYRKSLDKVQDQFARQVLTFLADEETEHIRKIEAFNASLLGGGVFDFSVECSISVRPRIAVLLGERIERKDVKIDPGSIDLDIYEMAMEMEKRSYDACERTLLRVYAHRGNGTLRPIGRIEEVS
ncbi:MAG TPA: hypothetical protein VGK02_05140 [Candidatus Aquicultor sp.]|jgi:hypothetical protein